LPATGRAIRIFEPMALKAGALKAGALKSGARMRP
jgi:hypothetical protein